MKGDEEDSEDECYWNWKKVVGKGRMFDFRDVKWG